MFKDSLENVQSRRPVKCIVGRWIENLDEVDRKHVLDAVEKGAGLTVLYRAARNYTYTGSENSWYRHWQGACACLRAN